VESHGFKPPKLPHVKEFQGDNRSDFQRFITDVQTFFAVTGLYSSDKANIGYVDSRLAGSANVWMTNLRIQHSKSPLPALSSFSVFEELFRYDPFEEFKADQELYYLRQGIVPFAMHILDFETIHVRSFRFTHGDSCVKEFVFSRNKPTKKS
jgi:hypothetical protein